MSYELYSMYYNINYEVTAIFLILIILVSRRRYLARKEPIVKKFLAASIGVIISCVLNIVAALCYDVIIHISDQGMLVLETIYLFASAASVYLMALLVFEKAAYSSMVLTAINVFLLGGTAILLLINLGPHFIFEYVDRNFTGYPLFNAVYIVSAVIYVEMAFVLFYRRNVLRRKAFMVTASIFFFPVLCIVIQFIDDHLLMYGIGATGALLLFTFTLGDEGYDKLQETMKELEQAKALEVSNKEKALAADRVRSLFMENISKEFRIPIQEVLNMTELMRQDKTDDAMDEYIDQMSHSGEQLLSFVDDLIEESKKN